MIVRHVVWLPTVRNKLVQYRSDHFSPEETFDFISELVLETEHLLSNSVLGKAYTEEYSYYKGMSRIVIRKFRIFFELKNNDVVIVAILFPGET